MMVISVSTGYSVAASTGVNAERANATGNQTADGGTYAVHQAGECYAISAVTGEKSIKEFYDYRTPYPDNPYTNATGGSYSSEGTTDLQEPNTSSLFLYADAKGNLSLVIVHGALNETSTGGSATFTIADLPENGTWAVKDDEYDDGPNYDNWTREDGTATVDWTWNEGRTDGGAYEGLGEDFNVTIEPAFNEEAALFGEYYDGTVDQWAVVSNTSDGLERTALNRTQNVSVSAGDCDDGAAKPTDSKRDKVTDDAGEKKPTETEDKDRDKRTKTEDKDRDKHTETEEKDTVTETEEKDTATKTEDKDRDKHTQTEEKDTATKTEDEDLDKQTETEDKDRDKHTETEDKDRDKHTETEEKDTATKTEDKDRDKHTETEEKHTKTEEEQKKEQDKEDKEKHRDDQPESGNQDEHTESEDGDDVPGVDGELGDVPGVEDGELDDVPGVGEDLDDVPGIEEGELDDVPGVEVDDLPGAADVEVNVGEDQSEDDD